MNNGYDQGGYQQQQYNGGQGYQNGNGYGNGGYNR